MKNLLAGFLFLFFIGFFIYGVFSESGNNNLKKWAAMTINFNRNHVIEREAALNNLDPDWLRATIFVESRGNSDAISPTGCRGITQINKRNAEYFGYSHKEMHDDEKALIVAARLTKEAEAFYHKSPAIKKGESLNSWLAREYNKGRGVARHNFLAGLAYSRNLNKVYKAIKDGVSEVALNGKIEKIDLAKINGEA